MQVGTAILQFNMYLSISALHKMQERRWNNEALESIPNIVIDGFQHWASWLEAKMERNNFNDPN